MRALALVPAALAAMLALQISPAASQQACSKEFQACMNYCGGKGSKNVQAGCYQGCEAKNNLCAEQVYGKRPGAMPAAAPAAAPAPRAPARDAQAEGGQEPARAEASAEERAPQKPQGGERAAKPVRR